MSACSTQASSDLCTDVFVCAAAATTLRRCQRCCALSPCCCHTARTTAWRPQACRRPSLCRPARRLAAPCSCRCCACPARTRSSRTKQRARASHRVTSPPSCLEPARTMQPMTPTVTPRFHQAPCASAICRAGCCPGHACARTGCIRRRYDVSSLAMGISLPFRASLLPRTRVHGNACGVVTRRRWRGGRRGRRCTGAQARNWLCEPPLGRPDGRQGVRRRQRCWLGQRGGPVGRRPAVRAPLVDA